MKPTDFPDWVFTSSGKRIQTTWLEIDKQCLLSTLCAELRSEQKMTIDCRGIDIIIPTIACYSIEMAIVAANATNHPVVFQSLAPHATAHIPSALRLCDARGDKPMDYLFGRSHILEQFGIATDTCGLIIFPKKVTGGLQCS